MSPRRSTKLTAVLATIALAVGLSACGAQGDHATPASLKIAAAPDPKGDITKKVIELAKAQGIDLELVSTTNSVNDHQLLEDGDVDIDFNSHVPWFNDQVATNHFKQTFVETVFLTPTGLLGFRRSLQQMWTGLTVVGGVLRLGCASCGVCGVGR
ncbi:MAG: MetQ/NlpA family ABC transporter substrate-binding protein [Mycobacterium sp.]